MTDQEKQQAVNSGIDFLVRLRTGQIVEDFKRFMSPGLENIGINSQAVCTQLDAILQTDGRVVPEVKDYIAAFIDCYNNDLLVDIPRAQPRLQQPAVQPTVQPEPPLSAAAQEALLMVRELELMRAQKRQQASKPAGPSMREKMEQHAKDESDWQSFKSEIGTAETINVLGFGGNINWAQTNTARLEAVKKCKADWTKKRPDWAEKIEQHNSSVLQPVEHALPENPTQAQMQAASPKVLAQWIKNKRHENRERLGEPGNDC